MREIFDGILKRYGLISRPKMKYEITRAAVKSGECALSVDVTLNFIMPPEAAEELIERIKEVMGGCIDTVFLNFKYENMIISDSQITEQFIPWMIKILNGEYAAITQFIIGDKFRVEGDKLTIAAKGEFAVEQLNRQVAASFGRLMKDNFGIERHVMFENDRETLSRDSDVMEAAREERINDSLREHAKDLKEKAASAEAVKSKTAENSGKNVNGGKKGKGNWKRKEEPASGNRIMGKTISSDATVTLSGFSIMDGEVVAEGEVFKISHMAKEDRVGIITMLLTDYTTTVCAKAFATSKKWMEVQQFVHAGDRVKIRGQVQWDKFEKCEIIFFKDLELLGKHCERMDTWNEGKRVELHAHTKMSAMDGLNNPEDIVNQAAKWGQPAVAITDHGVVQAFPDAAKAAKKLREKGTEIKVIYGMEGYVFDDSGLIDSEGNIDYKSRPTNHIILLAATQEGMKNIYKLVSYSHLNYFYKRPRLPKSVITAHREGIIIGSACEAGELYQAFYRQLPMEEVLRIAEFYDYFEIQPLINNRFMTEDRTEGGKYPERRKLTEDDLRDINRKIVALGEKLGKPVVATTDAHYDRDTSAIYRNIIMAGQGYKNAENGQGLFLRTTDEMMEEFAYLGEETAKKVVIDNTNFIADMVGDLRPVPKGKFPPKIDGAEETLRKSCMEKAHRVYGDPLPEEIAERLEKELNSIIDNGYAVMYVSAQMLVNKSLEDGYLVGSRGSVGSSFAATMAGITEVNPLNPHYICPQCRHLEWGDLEKYDCGIDMPPKKCPVCGCEMNRDGFTIPFATFLGFDGDKEPDIDLNFAGEYQATAHKYVGTIFGEKNVFKAGTVGTIADKTAYGYVMKFYQERGIPITKYEADRLAVNCTGVKRTTGQHPGGIVIVPDDHEIYEFCPVQHPANDTKSDIITTHFDYHKIDENLLKLDILGHNVPSMIRQLQDMTGVDPLTVPLTDRKVLSIFNGIEALDIKDENYKFTHGSYAIPEFGTSFVQQMLDDIQPERFADLVRISGFSHGNDVWLNNAQDYIKSGQATMMEVISTRDDIMNYLLLKGIENKMSFQIMEDVRKNRPLKDEQIQVMKEHGVPDWYIDSCIKIQYMFPRAHAVAYTMMSFRMAWYKVYYPKEFYATYFTSVVTDFNSDVILAGPAAIEEKMSEIRAKGKTATAKESNELTVLEVAYEMYARGYEFKDMALGESEAVRFTVSEGKVQLPFMALSGMGETAARSIVNEYDIKPYETVEEIMKRAKINKTSIEALRAKGVLAGLPETDQLSFF